MTDMIVSGLDQPIISTEEDAYALSKVDTAMAIAIQEKNVETVTDIITSFIRLQKASGLGLAKILWMAKKNWHLFEVEEDFIDYMFTATGLNKTTLDRYMVVWDMYESKNVPEGVQAQIRALNIKSQIPVAKALQQGYEITNEQWEKLANATDTVSVSKILREDIKGKEPRKGSLQVYLKRSGGVIAYQDDIAYEIGWLNVLDETPAVQQVIERIKKSSGILEA